jgi:hypothetical protein
VIAHTVGAQAARTKKWIGPSVAKRIIKVRDELTGELVEMTIPVPVEARTVYQDTGEPTVDDFVTLTRTSSERLQ